MADFPIAVCTDITSTRKQSSRQFQMVFGYGYRQIANIGLNSNLEKWTLVTGPLEGTILATLEAFILLVGSGDIFNWTNPLGITNKYRIDVDGISRVDLASDRKKYTLQITQTVIQN
ncbi:MAG: phage tail protein [Burkholderiales bacterium]